jgi:hypothetical protein
MVFPSYSHDFPIIFPSYSHHIPMIFPSYSHHIPTISPSYSHDIPIIVPLFHRRKAENQLRARELVELRKLREGEPRRRRMGYGIRYPMDILRMEIYRWGMLGYSWWWIFMNEIDILHVFLGDYVKHFFLGNITMIDWGIVLSINPLGKIPFPTPLACKLQIMNISWVDRFISHFVYWSVFDRWEQKDTQTRQIVVCWHVLTIKHKFIVAISIYKWECLMRKVGFGIQNPHPPTYCG